MLYGEYGKCNDSAAVNTAGILQPVRRWNGHRITGSDTRQWGVGVVQEIDAAAMSVWLS